MKDIFKKSSIKQQIDATFNVYILVFASQMKTIN